MRGWGATRGELLARVWRHDATVYAPRCRRACAYDAFVPWTLSGESLALPAEIMGVVSEAERAVAPLNADAHPAPAPLARLILRTEAIASSKVEGLQVDARALARAEARDDHGVGLGADLADVLANIDAMQLAVEDAVEEELSVRRFAVRLWGVFVVR